MSLESFYGGKQGISPVIKGSFKYIDENDPAYIAAIAAIDAGTSDKDKEEINNETMDLCFLNPNYKDIWYNELCIIDTESKNNSNNGKLYRRTLKGLGNIGTNLCAEYIGQIVGPAGGNPRMEFMSIEDLKTKASGLETKDNKTISYPGQNNQEPFNPNLLEIFDDSTGNAIFVPGKVSENEYNDNIKYTWVNFIDDKSTEESVVYMGFKIPYTVFDFTTESVSWTQEVNIQDNSSDEHPFYKNINIQVPRGVRGNAPLNFRVVKSNIFNLTDNPLYNWDSSVQYNESDGRYSFKNDAKPINTANTSIALSILVYDYIFYDEKIEGPSKFYTKTFFLSNYKEIGSILNDVENKMILFTFNDGTRQPIMYPYPESLIKNDKGIITLTFGKYNGGTLAPFDDIILKNNDNDNTDFKLDYIEDTKVWGSTAKANLFVLHSSSYYRVVEKEEDGSVNYYYKDKKINSYKKESTLDNGKTKITFKENSNNLVFVKMDDEKWWQDLGIIGKYTKGIRVTEAISYTGDSNSNIDSYMSYNDYKEYYKNDANKKNIAFIDFLNLEKWLCYKKVENPVFNSENSYYIKNENGTYEERNSYEENKTYYELVEDNNPYYGGRFRSFSGTGNWLDEGFLWANIGDGGSAYFYDHFEQTWKLLGRWEDTNSQLVFSDIEGNDAQVSDTGLVLTTIEQPSNLNIGLLNVWAQV